jgi:hypothetical protein
LSNCRACGSTLELQLIDLGTSPISNKYLTFAELQEPESWFPLKVLVCEICWLAQIDCLIDPENLFVSDYAYLSSISASWLTHAKEFVSFLTRSFSLDHQSFVLEIASNDGYLLENFVQQNIRCLGVEPTEYAAILAEKRGVPTYRDFYNVHTATLIASEYGKATILIANNVLAHVPNPCDLLQAIHFGLSEHGVASLEFPHLVPLVQDVKFDTIYHEHYSYFSLSALINLASKCGLKVIGADKLDTHGGSLRVFLSKDNSNVQLPFETQLLPILREESELGVCTKIFYSDFQAKAVKIRNQLLRFVLECQEAGLKIAAYGAAAKGNTLLNFLGLRQDQVVFVVDKSPSKQGKFLPGSRIPIVKEEVLLDQCPEIILVLPWNLELELTSQLSYVPKYGGKLVFPLPKLKIVS